MFQVDIIQIKKEREREREREREFRGTILKWKMTYVKKKKN